MDGFLTMAEAAQMLGVSYRTVIRWCANGTLRGAVKVGPPRRGLWLVPLQSVEEYRANRLVQRK